MHPVLLLLLPPFRLSGDPVSEWWIHSFIGGVEEPLSGCVLAIAYSGRATSCRHRACMLEGSFNKYVIHGISVWTVKWIIPDQCVESPLANRESFNSFECFLIGGLSRHPLIVCCVAVSLVVARHDSQQAIHSVQSFNQGSVFCEEELCRDWELLVLIICPPLDNVLWHCYRYCFVICNESQLIENITFCADDDTRAEARTRPASQPASMQWRRTRGICCAHSHY